MAGNIHWCGCVDNAGLEQLIESGGELRIWDSRPQDQLDWLKRSDTLIISLLDLPMLKLVLQSGDVLISMLPAAKQELLAELAMAAGAHFIGVGNAKLAEQHQDAEQKGICCVYELSAQPGAALVELVDKLLAGTVKPGCYRGSELLGKL